jgi:hypothetical protein
MVVRPQGEKEVALYAWADARFTTDILAKHAVFFAMLEPPEVAAAEWEEALHFGETFAGPSLRCPSDRVRSTVPSDGRAAR